jgi:hypothetical protein
MNNIKKFNEFVNEGLLSNIFSKIKGYLSQGLQELMKDVKSGDPKKMIKSLKNYIQLNGKELDNKLKEINTKSELREYLKNTLYGLYSAIKGIQSTQKIDPVYFENMFKNSDKNLVKLMNTKESKFESSLEEYLDKYLIPGLYKISGIKNESYLFESDETKKLDDEISKTEQDIKDKQEDNNPNKDESKEQVDPNKDKNKNKKQEEQIPDKIKQVTKGWITNILSPILKIEEPNNSNNQNIIPTSDNSQIKREVVQDMIKNSSIDQIKKFREMIGQNKKMSKKEWKKKWPVGK